MWTTQSSTTTTTTNNNSTTTATMWSSLPCESLALIAAQLEGPDRQCLALSCASGRQAAAITTQAIVLPGSQVFRGKRTPTSCTRSGCSECSCNLPAAADSCDAGSDSDSQRSSKNSTSSSTTTATASTTTATASASSSSLLQLYTGVRELTITPCDSCQQVTLDLAAPWGTGCTQLPCSPCAPSWGSTAVSSTRRSSSTMPQPGHGLTCFLAAVGGSMPYLQQLDLSAACPCLLSSSSSSSSCSSGVLATLAAACPRLAVLSIPTWLLKQPAVADAGQSSSSSSSSNCSSEDDGAAGSPHAAKTGAHVCGHEIVRPPASHSHQLLADLHRQSQQSPTQQQQQQKDKPSGFDLLDMLPAVADVSTAPPELCQRRLTPQQQQQPEELSSLAGLCHVTALKLTGCMPPAAIVRQLAGLTTLNSFSLEVVWSSAPSGLLPLAALPGWHANSNHNDNAGIDGSAVDGNSHGRPSSSSSSTGSLLGNSLAQLVGLTSLTLSGGSHADHTLIALAGLPTLARVELSSLPDFAVSSLASLSGLTGLTGLRVQGCRALKVTARSALPLQLHSLQHLAVLELDFELHLRDMQVLCLLKRLSHLTATGFHHCIHLMTGLSLPALRSLRISSMTRVPLQPPQGFAGNMQIAQLLVAPQAAAAAAAAAGVAAIPAAAAGAGGVPPVPAIAGAAGAGGVPVIPLSALPLLANVQQQHLQEDHPAYVLLAPPGAQAVLLQHPGINMHQAPGSVHQPIVYGAPAAAALPAPVQQQQQQGGAANGINLQLLQLRQQQLNLQQQQLRLQQQQVRLQLQQIQAQALQQPANQPAAAQNAAAGGAPAAMQLPQQQQQQQQYLQQYQQVRAPFVVTQQANVAAVAGAGGASTAAAVAAAAANDAAPPAGYAQTQGWLAVLFPGLEELHLTRPRDSAAAVPALQAHQNLRRLVLGTPKARQARLLQQQQRGFIVPATAAGSLLGLPAEGASELAARQTAAALPAVPWAVLRSLPCLESLEIYDAAAVLGSTPWVLGSALSSQLVHLVLWGANNLSDLAVAALLGPYVWSRLEHLEVEGAQGLSHRGMASVAGLPVLRSLHLSFCPNVTASSLGSCLLSSSSSLKQVKLLCCAGVTPLEAQAVQEALWTICHRSIDVSWSRAVPEQTCVLGMPGQ